MNQPSRSSRPRVLFCTWGYPPDGSGGAEAQAALQAEELHRRGYEVKVVCTRRGGQRSSSVNGVEVVRVPRLARWRLGRFFPVLLFFYVLLSLRRFQIVHIHLATLQTTAVCLAAWVARRPVYLKVASSGRGADVEYMQATWLRKRLTLNGNVTFQAISDAIRDELLAAGVPAHRIVRISNGVMVVDADWRQEHEQREARSRLDLPLEGPVVLFVGRFVRNKGIDVLLDAWSKVGADATLVLLGRRYANVGSTEFHVTDTPPNVVVRDWTEDTDDYYVAADVFVLPSYREGMSNALLEAMSRGMAVIATRVGAAEELIENGESGILIDAGDIGELAAALDTLLCDPPLRQRFGDRAAGFISANYGVVPVVDKRIEAAYAALLKN